MINKIRRLPLPWEPPINPRWGCEINDKLLGNNVLHIILHAPSIKFHDACSQRTTHATPLCVFTFTMTRFKLKSTPPCPSPHSVVSSPSINTAIKLRLFFLTSAMRGRRRRRAASRPPVPLNAFPQSFAVHGRGRRLTKPFGDNGMGDLKGKYNY